MLEVEEKYKIPKQQKLLPDLYWYFNDFASVCGLRSNYKEMVLGSSSFEWEPDLDLISKARKVENNLRKLSIIDRNVLHTYFTFAEERNYPVIRFLYKEYLNVARLFNTREELSTIKTRKKHDELLSNSKKAVKLAIQNYAEVSK